MSLPTREVLAAKGIYPPTQQLPQLEAKWVEIQNLKRDLREVLTPEADIALRNMAAGEHRG